MAPKSRFASKGAFDALALDESDADQDLSEDVIAEEDTAPKSLAKIETPSKNTRLARKSTKKNSSPLTKVVDNSNKVTDSENDLEVMTTRSGSRIRHLSVPNVQEEESSPVNGTAKISTTEAEKNVIPTIEEPKSEKRVEGIPSSSLQVPDSIYGKSSSSKQVQQGQTKEEKSKSKTEEEMESEARKAYWKKIYERTIFSLFMIGGFTGKSCR